MTKPDFTAHFVDGVDRFNARKFWDAHEAWETIWLEAESEVVQFLQGLIQIAAAYHHVQRGTLRGAIRLFDAGLQKLAPFPSGYCDLDRGAVERAAAVHREMLLRDEASAIEFPTLTLRTRTPAPPFVQW